MNAPFTKSYGLQSETKTDCGPTPVHFAVPARALTKTLFGLSLLFASSSSTWSQFQDDELLADSAMPAQSIHDSHGLVTREGVPMAGGRDYRARFDQGCFEFTPALGEAAPATMPFSFELLEITRGSRQIQSPTELPSAQAEQDSVAYYRAGGIVERYDIQSDGVHQTFLFPQPLEGDGDLVVRGRIKTELAFTGSTEEGGLRFELPGVGGVHYGSVTGIDANGVEAKGNLRYTDGVIELTLPGDFVDHAAYPLLLDPLVGSDIALDSGSTWDDGDASVAFESTNNVYLVAWERTFSAADVEVRAQRMSKNGTLQGTTLFLSGTSFREENPAVGVVAGSDRFFVAWQSESGDGTNDIVGLSVEASDGSVSNLITVADTANSMFDPVIGGERTAVDDDLIVVWSENNVGIRAVQVSLPVAGGPPFAVSAYRTVAPEGPDFPIRPAISRSGGDTGTYLIAWEKLDFAGHSEVYGRFYDRNLQTLGSGSQRISDSYVSGSAQRPSVDGDGTNFVVAWQVEEFLHSSDTDIAARAVSFAGGDLNFATGVVLVESNANDDESDPVVAYTGEVTVIAYLDKITSTYAVYAKSIDPFTCLLCENEFLIQTLTTSDAMSVAIGSSWSGADSMGLFDDALIVWSTLPDGDTTGDLLAVRYDSQNPNADLGGGCGSGGENLAPCAIQGNSNFAVTLRNSVPNTKAYLVVSGNQAPLPCGSCTLFPALDASATLFSTSTDAVGNAQVDIPLPLGLVGSTAYSQWAVLSPGADCPALGGLELSNALLTTIQP